MARLVGQESRDSQCLANCMDVAAELLSALQRNDIKTFDRLLDDAEPEEINKHHEYPHYTTCLQLACHNGQADFLALLIKHDAEVDTYNPEKSTRPLHMACVNAHHNCVELLLEGGADVNGRDGHSRQTPLHVVMSTWKELKDSPTIRFPSLPFPSSKESKFAKCFQLLLEHPKVDLEAEDDRGRTPLEWAVWKQNGFAIKTLINHGVKVNEQVRQAVKKTQKSMPEIEELIDLTAQRDQPLGEINPSDQIRDMIRRKDHVQLQKLLKSLPTQLDDTTQSLTCIQFCIQEGSVECLRILLEAGANPKLFSYYESRSPIVLAAYNGNAQILEVLLANPIIEVNAFDSPKSRQTALHKVVLRLSENRSQYLECLSILLQSKETIKNIDSRDVLGNTALHYAVQTGVEDAVLLLLRNGASLGSKNVLNETPINNMLPTTLETFLDECIEQNKDEGRSSCDYHITFKYSFLASKAQNNCFNNANGDAASVAKRLEDKESGNFIPKTEGPYENLSHPDHTKGDGCYPESEALWYLSCSDRHKYLLRHPVVTSFLLLKWHKIRSYFYVNLFIYLFAVLVLTSYVLVREQTEQSTYTGSPRDPQVGLNILWYVLAFLVATLFLREFFQFGIAPMRYVWCVENYFELGMIINTGIILVYSGESESVRHYSAMAVLCAWGAFLLLIGREPKLSILVETFTCVTRSFFKLLLWYSILIFGFALSFHLLFKKPASSNTDESPAANATTSEPAEDAKQDNFQTLLLTMLKMVAMMTGELEFSELPFDMSPVISRLIFLAFVFLITVVLLNLLNGLAVSDTQAIYNEAETFKYANLVQLISYIEAMLLGDPFHFLSNYPPFRWLRRLPDANCCRLFLRMPSLRPFMQSYSTLLFERCLPSKAYTVYPNHRGTRGSSKDVIGIPKCTCHNEFSLPYANIEAACERLKEMHNPKESRYLANDKWEAKFDELRQTVTTLSENREVNTAKESETLLTNQGLKDKFEELSQAIKSLSENQVEMMRLLQRTYPQVTT